MPHVSSIGALEIYHHLFLLIVKSQSIYLYMFRG